MAGLAWVEFKKRYKNNLEVVYDKAKNKEPIDLTEKIQRVKGNGLRFKYDRIILKSGPKQSEVKISDFKTKDSFVNHVMLNFPLSTPTLNISFSDGTVSISSGKIQKSVEFGGKNPTGSKKANIVWGQLGILKESMDSTYVLDAPTLAEPDELKYLNDLNGMIYEEIKKHLKDPRSMMDKLCPGLTVKVGKHTFNDVVGVNKVSGTPKADLVLVSCKNKKLIGVCFISHKKGGGAKAFQQYGGISKQSGDIIYGDNLVKKYVEDLRNAVGNDTASSGQSFYRYIENNVNGKKLVGRSVYGPDWNGGSTFGIDSVHCIAQGDPVLTKQNGNVYKLNASDSLHTANDINWAFNNDYKAVFASTYRAGRKTDSQSGVFVNNLRSGIYPYQFVANRNAKEI